MRRNPIIAIWIVGLLAALLAYAGNADQLAAALGMAIRHGIAVVAAVMDQFARLRPGVLRALAIGLFVTFAALALLAVRRGKQGRAALVLVTIGFAWSVSGQDGWLGPLALSGTAAAVMTARLRG